MSELFVLVPDPKSGDLVVCEVDELSGRLGDETVDEALSNAGIDSFSHDDAEAIAAVQELNRTGNAADYWSKR